MNMNCSRNEYRLLLIKILSPGMNINFTSCIVTFILFLYRTGSEQLSAAVYHLLAYVFGFTTPFIVGSFFEIGEVPFEYNLV